MGGAGGTAALLALALAASPVPWVGAEGGVTVERVIGPHGDTVHHVHVEGFAFDPSLLNIPDGDGVEWHNHDPFTHTATDSGGMWDTGDIGGGQSQTLFFVGAASYAYVCIYHGFMTGTLEVEGEANQPPSVAITAPAEGAMVQGVTVIEGTAEDPDGALAGVEVRIDGGPWEAASGLGSWMFSWDTTTAADGPHSIEARATDDQGATSPVASRGLTVANPPAVAITSPAEGAALSGTITIEGTASDPGPASSLTGVEVRIDDGPWELASGTTSWAFVWNTNSVGDGAHTVSARASDGALFSEVAAVNVGVDNANLAPTVAIVAPEPGAVLAGSVSVEGTADDLDGLVALVEVRIDGGVWQAADGTTVWSFSWETLGVPDGARTVEARATDDAGAASTVDSRSVTVANPPIVAITAPPEGATVEGPVSIEGTASDPGAGGSVALVEVRIDGGAWQAASGTTSWSLAWDTTTVGDGARLLEARATDGAGNTALASRGVTVANPPQVAITAPLEGQEVEGLVVVAGTASDPGGSVTLVEVRIDGGAWQPADGTTAWTFDWHTDALLDGTHTVEARSTDGALFSALAAVAVVTDNQHADLVVPTVAAAGDLFEQGIAVVVENRGDEAAGPFVVEVVYVGADGEEHALGQPAVPGLAIGQAIALALTWDAFGKVGNFTLLARADIAGAVEEHDEGNNEGAGFACVPGLAGAGCLLPRTELR